MVWPSQCHCWFDNFCVQILKIEVESICMWTWLPQNMNMNIWIWIYEYMNMNMNMNIWIWTYFPLTLLCLCAGLYVKFDEVEGTLSSSFSSSSSSSSSSLLFVLFPLLLLFFLWLFLLFLLHILPPLSYLRINQYFTVKPFWNFNVLRTEEIDLFYSPHTECGKVMFLLCVSIHRVGGGCLGSWHQMSGHVGIPCLGSSRS